MITITEKPGKIKRLVLTNAKGYLVFVGDAYICKITRDYQYINYEKFRNIQTLFRNQIATANMNMERAVVENDLNTIHSMQRNINNSMERLQFIDSVLDASNNCNIRLKLDINIDDLEKLASIDAKVSYRFE